METTISDSIPGLSSAALYGKGIFTTISILRGQPFLWEKHWRRLTNDSAKLGIDMAEFLESKVRDAVEDLIHLKKLTNGRARITFFDSSSSKIWPFDSTAKTSLLIMTGDPRPVPVNFRLTESPYPVNSLSPLAGVKSCNYLENILALDEAKGHGFDEAVRVNERGEVTSGVMANVFWLRDDVLYTPSLKTGCLAGTSREFVLENLVAREVEATIDDLKAADAIFLTSAGLGVVQAAEFDSRSFNPTDHAVTRLLPVTR
jgi:branched-subunit amino acid aminotransferase/4-amino-4-deoxychorismate lyase